MNVSAHSRGSRYERMVGLLHFSLHQKAIEPGLKVPSSRKNNESTDSNIETLGDIKRLVPRGTQLTKNILESIVNGRVHGNLRRLVHYNKFFFAVHDRGTPV